MSPDFKQGTYTKKGREIETLKTQLHFNQSHLILLQPQRLMSPDTLLRRRLGNSFEMATLLVSLLINNGFRRAYVVAGYASREVVNNDQRRIESPYMPGPIVVSSMGNAQLIGLR